MRIAICADIHDNIWVLDRALPHMNAANVLLFCGDFCAPFTLTQMARGFEGPIHAVFGNNDGDLHLLTRVAREAGNVMLHGQLATIEIDSLRVAMNHYPEIAAGLAQSGLYDVVCYGHDHQLHEEKIRDSMLLNPGELMGRFGRHTFMMLDTSSKSVTIHDVE